MTILLLGASGFIGSAIGQALLADGHSLRAAGRDLAYGRRVLPQAEWVFADLRGMGAAAAWRPLVEGIDIVINASGALQSGLRDHVGQVQERAIVGLVDAARAGAAAHFVQLSAAGADRQASDFMLTKARADAALAASGLAHTILRPGLVIGRNGFGGSELLRAAAGMPLAHIELAGTGPIQCVALADVVAAVRRIVAEPDAVSGSFDLVEAQARSLGEIVALHRQWLALPAPRFTLRVAVALLRPAALIAGGLGWLGWRSPLRSNALAALVQGIAGDAVQARKVLGREPLSLPETLASLGPAGKADRWHARLAGLYPLALGSLLLLWLGSGSLGLLRTDAAAALLVEGGMAPGTAQSLVIAGSLADLAIAAGIVFRPSLKLALIAGTALAVAYAGGATVVRPDLWLDPLGPMLKVIPIIVLSAMSLAMAEER